MKRCLWMIFMVVGICMLTGCSSDDDKLDSLPWNDKELFNQSFVLNQDGYCILDGKAPVCDIDTECSEFLACKLWLATCRHLSDEGKR